MQLTFYVVPMRIPSHVLPMVWASISCLSPCLRLLFALNGKHRSRMLDLYSVSVEACARCRLRVLARTISIEGVSMGPTLVSMSSVSWDYFSEHICGARNHHKTLAFSEPECCWGTPALSDCMVGSCVARSSTN